PLSPTPTPTPYTYPPPLHDALPISRWARAPTPPSTPPPTTPPAPPSTGLGRPRPPAGPSSPDGSTSTRAAGAAPPHRRRTQPGRSEEHTSELQSRVDLVCRLLLEKT